MNIHKILLSRFVVAGVLTTAMLSSCTSCKDESNNNSNNNTLIEPADTIKTSVLNIGGELFSVPSPIQTALLIQKSGVPYDKNTLNPHNKVNTFDTDYSRSLNLGIYGADLGYVSLYNQTQDALGYLGAVKQLADKLGISAAFDATTIERIQKNITNKDSMMVLVGIAYRGSDSYLKNNQRHDVSSLILTGGWIESMHFSTSGYKAKPSNDMKFRIAEQKLALNSLIKILGNNPAPQVKDLTAQLSDLAKVYEGISFKYNFVEPVTDTAKKVTMVNSTTEVMISDEQVKQITEKIMEIRNKIVNIQS
jgi:hypothetical protein